MRVNRKSFHIRCKRLIASVLEENVKRETTVRIFLIVLVLLIAFLAYKVWRVGSLALSLKARADRLLALQPDQVKLDSLGPVISDVHGARSELDALHSELGPLLAVCPALGWLPRYGADVASAPALMDMAVELADAGDILLTSVQPQLDSLQGGKLSIQNAVQMMADIQPALDQATLHLDKAIQARARITRPLSPRVAGWLTKADKALPMAVAGADAAKLAPYLLGLEGPRTFLVLAQNSDELRATGGFISSVGRVVIKQGQIISQTFEDSYAVDDFQFSYPDPPSELLTYMGSQLWVFRDSNWSPDFPTSAQDAIRLYQVSRPGPVDGVIVVNLQAVPALFEGLGPITVPGFDQPVTGQTVIPMMRQALLSDPSGQLSAEWWAHRKDFAGALVGAVLARIQSGLTSAEMMRLARASMEALNRHDMLIYLESPEAQRVLAQLKWDGALAHPSGDMLMVVDSNMGFNKVNPKIDEQLSYTVQLDGAGAGQATLLVTHASRAKPESVCDPSPRYDPTYEGMMDRCYWDLVRVYAPAGSALVTATLQSPAPLVGNRFSDGKPAVANDQGRPVFESFFALNGGARQVTRFDYTLPQVVVEEGGAHVYSLYVQRQPSTGDWPLEVTVMLPAGAKVIKTEPTVLTDEQPATSSEQPVLHWSLRLTSDQQVRVWYRAR